MFKTGKKKENWNREFLDNFRHETVSSELEICHKN